MGETRERYSTHALNLLLGRKGRANPQGCWLQARKPRDRGKLYGAPSAGPSTVGHWTWADTRLTLHRAPLICTCAAAAACCEGFVSVGGRSRRQLPPGDDCCLSRAHGLPGHAWCLMRRNSGRMPTDAEVVGSAPGALARCSLPALDVQSQTARPFRDRAESSRNTSPFWTFLCKRRDVGPREPRRAQRPGGHKGSAGSSGSFQQLARERVHHEVSFRLMRRRYDGCADIRLGRVLQHELVWPNG